MKKITQETPYFNNIKDFQEKIETYCKEIFKVYGNELVLRLEELNLLSNKDNCIESSTAVGYLMEEFLVSKLEIYTKDHNLPKEYKITRHNNSSTVKVSYDCSSIIKDGIKALINIKVCKKTNNAVAALNMLYTDYVKTDPSQKKCFLVLKIHYLFDNSKNDGERKIFIKKIESYFLEEIDFSKGHKQDHRNWSQKEYNPNSGRLQISESFLTTHKKEIKDVSYDLTCKEITNLINKNKGKIK